MIRVLRLGSSIDVEGETPPDERAAATAGRMLAAAAGEPVETVARPPWPNSSLPDVLEAWVNETRPDLICFNISSFWSEAEVVGERLSRLGRGGRWFSGKLNAATSRYEFNANPLVRQARKLAPYTVPGRPPFEPAEAAANIDRSLRRVLRHENVGIVVCGSPFSPALHGGAAARQRARARRTEFFGRLAESCEALHIPYDLPPHAADAFDQALRTRDGLHFSPEMHRRTGEMQGRLMVLAWQRTTAGR